MYLMKKRKRRKKIKGRGIQRPYVSKRNRLMLGKGKKQRGGFFLTSFIFQKRAMLKKPV